MLVLCRNHAPGAALLGNWFHRLPNAIDQFTIDCGCSNLPNQLSSIFNIA